jgi:hypothetical protein
MKLRHIKFMQAVSLDGRMVERADEGAASALGVVVSASTPVLVPWHMVRWAEVVEEKPEEAPRTVSDAIGRHVKRGKPTP